MDSLVESTHRSRPTEEGMTKSLEESLVPLPIDTVEDAQILNNMSDECWQYMVSTSFLQLADDKFTIL